MLLTKLLSFANVAPNSVASVSLPLGPTYERFTLVLGGTSFTKAMVLNIKLRLNGKVVVDIDGPTLDKLNSYTGLAADPALLTLDFTEIYARDQVGQSYGAIATSYGVQTATLEVQIGAATAPTLDCFVATSAPRQPLLDQAGQPILIIEKLLPYTATFNAGGKFNLPVPFGAQGSVIKRAYFSHTGNMSALEVKKNGVVIFEAPKAVNEFIQKENKKTPQANLFVWDTIVDWNMDQMVKTTDANAFEMNVTLTAADTVKYWVEYIDPLRNL